MSKPLQPWLPYSKALAVCMYMCTVWIPKRDFRKTSIKQQAAFKALQPKNGRQSGREILLHNLPHKVSKLLSPWLPCSTAWAGYMYVSRVWIHNMALLKSSTKQQAVCKALQPKNGIRSGGEKVLCNAPQTKTKPLQPWLPYFTALAVCMYVYRV